MLGGWGGDQQNKRPRKEGFDSLSPASLPGLGPLLLSSPALDRGLPEFLGLWTQDGVTPRAFPGPQLADGRPWDSSASASLESPDSHRFRDPRVGLEEGDFEAQFSELVPGFLELAL